MMGFIVPRFLLAFPLALPVLLPQRIVGAQPFHPGTSLFQVLPELLVAHRTAAVAAEIKGGIRRGVSIRSAFIGQFHRRRR